MKFIYSIAVARHTKHLGFTGIIMKYEPRTYPSANILYYIRFPPQHVY